MEMSRRSRFVVLTLIGLPIATVAGASLLEVFNGHPATNSPGGPGKASAEEIWDGVLSAGRVIFGAATDDSHNYKDFTPQLSNPGRGWVVVRAPELTPGAVVEALETGQFYSSTGVTLLDVEMSARSCWLRIEPQRDFLYATTFSGRDGVVHATADGPEPSYRPRGDEGYVRATVTSSGGLKAWTQPVFLG